MALDQEIREQLKPYLDLLENDLVITASLGDDDASASVKELVEELAALSPRITVKEAVLERTPSFAIDQKDQASSGVVFAGLPLGHEFSSLVLALVQVSGRPPKIEEEEAIRIKSITTPLQFETYVSLTCHNCPDVVQALNIMSVLNPNISHTMIEGKTFQAEVDAKDVMAVPTVFLNGEEFASGRQTLAQLLDKVAEPTEVDYSDKEPYDVLVVGGGPAGASAAIYAARKGIRTGIVAETFGGQVMETLGIENMIGTPYTEGPRLMNDVKEHVKKYGVDLILGQKVDKLEKTDQVEVTLANGNVLKSKTAVLATGARWRSIGVPGEQEFKNKGIAYCPHCDGPLFEGKKVVVIGGGNSGIEAALDLANMAEHVTVLEFLPELKADKVLQDRLAEQANITVITNAQTTAIEGTTKVEGVSYTDRISGEAATIEAAGCFILIGLAPNTDWLKDSVDLNPRGEIIVDKAGATNLPGVFAAGDCTDSAYKQIIISMGSGATAALGAFDYMLRN